MGRRWVGVERSGETVETYARPRLEKVVEGRDPGGVTAAVGWEGGGGFRLLTVAPSMFEATDGHVALAGWATDGALSEATAAQLGFDHAPDAPFSGQRGRSRLAVVDGLVNAAVVELLIGALGEGETLVAAGTAVDPAARVAARALRPGSTVRKIPRSILQEYRQAARWLQTALPDEPTTGREMAVTADPEAAAVTA